MPVGKIRAQYQERVASLHRGIAGGEADEAGHADVERIVVFDVLLAAQRMDDRRVELAGEFDHLVVRAGAARPAEQRHALARIEKLRQRGDFAVGRPNHRRLGDEPGGRLRLGWFQRDVARDHHDRDAAFGDGDADRVLKDPRQLLRVRDQLDVMAAFGEQDLGMGRLKIIAADLGAWDMRGDRQHRHAGRGCSRRGR